MTGEIMNLHPTLWNILRTLEQRMGFPLTILSGYRTPEHNADPKVGGVTNSEHTYEPAEGADVFCQQSRTRYKMLKELYALGVKRIGIGNTFIHVGISTTLPNEVAWDYYDDKKPETPVEV